VSASGKRRFLYWLVGGVALGVGVGLVGGEHVAVLGEFGALVIVLLKALAMPLVFFAVADSLQKAELPVRQGVRLLGLCVTNAAVACALAVSLAYLIRPGAGVDPALFSGPAPAAPLDVAVLPLPQRALQLLLNNAVLVLVLLALASGAALRRLRHQGRAVRLGKLVEDGFQFLATVLSYVILLVPLAVFGVVAKMVGTLGLAPFRSLGMLCLTVAAGLILHVTNYYTLLVWVVGRRSPLDFWRAATDALITALSTGSSMATLPVTLRTLEDRLHVTPQSARLAACIGTNFNNDGIMLYEVVAAIFIAQAAGIDLDPAQIAMLAATSALAAAGIAGVPEAGLITLSLVMSAAGLPAAGLPMLLSVDWMLGRLRAATNVASDLTIATVLDRWAGPAEPRQT